MISLSVLKLYIFVFVISYLIGSLPFGYLIGRCKGIDLFKLGSGNIGATNVGRILGWPYGFSVFILDFVKGAIPPLILSISVIYILSIDMNAVKPVEYELLKVVSAGATFLGHLFPVYLRFRGGKGIATGAGTVIVLVPEAAICAFIIWILTVLVTRYVSLASLLAVITLFVIYLYRTNFVWQSPYWPITLYLSVGILLVFIKHRDNVRRLWYGHENRVGEWSMRQPVIRILHILSLAIWFGGAFFFNFVAAPSIFRSFEEVVHTAPSDRTAYEQLLPPDADEMRKNALASALAGSAVGPIFPRYFLMQTICAIVAGATAAAWWHYGMLHRWRLILVLVAAVGVAVGWPLSDYVGELRLARYSSDPNIALAARTHFATMHSYSLLLNLTTTIIIGICLILAAWMPTAREAKSDTK
jgi:acyl-phosphate glycerol 3-phosphate acyltransferase